MEHQPGIFGCSTQIYLFLSRWHLSPLSPYGGRRSGFPGLRFQPVTQEPFWAHLSVLNWAPGSAGAQQGERGEVLSPWEAGVEKSKAGTVRFIPG